MIDYERQFERPDYASSARQSLGLSATFRHVYGWMCAGLALSGVVAWYTAASGLYQTVLAGPGFIGCAVVELLLVMGLSFAIRKIPVAVAVSMFIAYAAVNGLTLSVVFIAYDLASVQRAFFVTAGMFGGLAVWGSVTKSDLSSIGSVCGMALWGVVIASVVNLFLRSSGLDWAISFIAILVFTGLTMYDAQKIRQIAAREGTMDSESIRRVGVIGALTLYLDFVNLFIQVLRFLGNKRK